MRSGCTRWIELALLTDRVLLAEGRPQRYGTQAVLVDGRYEVRETEDLARFTAPWEQPSVGVDRLRKLVL